jgi:hypothetical protein
VNDLTERPSALADDLEIFAWVIADLDVHCLSAAAF